MAWKIRPALIAVLTAAALWFSPTPSPAQLDETPLDVEVTAAVADLVQRVPGLAKRDVSVVLADRITWNDASFGCPEPGRMYAMALASGYKIILEAHGVIYHYNGLRGSPPTFCATMSPHRLETPPPGGTPK